ncbi:malignant fibrous histiocytoma-amplified sequence 1 homolog [Mytilus galloprovincialis]|uniref:malignant fibrous histiocytoma-amplified sequence 1 homolog n=1 Tax=Mytilus galloprovincialis TaxID=29158 RepID=UPI003F7BA4BA
MMATSGLKGPSEASEALKKYVQRNQKGQEMLVVPEGKWKGWVPRSIYSMRLEEVCLPFLKLQSFPVGGTAIGSLVSMKHFNATGNYIQRLPNSFGTCNDLERLNLSFNLLDQIPSSVFSLENLTSLDISDNDISFLSPEIGRLKKLRELNACGNILSEVPEELAECQNLQKLNLSRKWHPKNGAIKVLPPAVCHIKELTELNISWHQINTIPDDIQNLTKLQRLIMKGNFLKYVPSSIGKCLKLQELDLSGAMKLNSYIPPELFLLKELKVLNISGNYFTEISKDIKGLKNLRKLIIQRNALLRLPNELFKCKRLESLQFSDNYLEEIPPLVKRLKNLKYIDLQGNKLKSLPDEICQCENLVQINVAMNMMESLPDLIYLLENLQELNIEQNRLKSLPPMMDKLEKLERLSLHSNTLSVPPQEVCQFGIETVFKFLRELRISCAKHRRKMILIGAAKAGKTSLRNALMLGKSKLTAEHERTWVLERHLWEPESDLRVQLLDFGGHHIYSAAHHLFLTPEALHVLVCDLSKYSPDLYDYMVGSWIDAIIDRAPGATILLVGTHADLCEEHQIEEHTINIIEKMQADEKEKVQDLQFEVEKLKMDLKATTGKDSGTKFEDIKPQRLREKLNHLHKLLNERVPLPDKMYVVSCAEDFLNIPEFKADLTKKLKETDERPLPKAWYLFLTKLHEVTDKVLHWEQAITLFEETMSTLKQSMISLEGSAEKSLDVILRYLHSTGEIIWYHDNPKLRGLVFHRPETLVEMLRTIFHHDFKKHVIFDDSHSRMAGLNRNKFDLMKEDFLTKGLMTVELMHYCLLHFKLSADARDMFIDLMLKFDLCYEVPRIPGLPSTYGASRVLRFPWFLEANKPVSVTSTWPEKTPFDTIEIRYQLEFVKKLPPNFFEKLNARLQSHVLNREDWKNGTLAFRNRSKLLVEKTTENGNVNVNVSVRGSDIQELWFLILKVSDDTLSLLLEWPFVRFKRYLYCSHCVLRGDNDPTKYPGEVLEMRCQKGMYEVYPCNKQKDAMVPACLVVPLDPEYVDDADLSGHIRTVTEFLRNLCDTVDGPGHLQLFSEIGLMYVASKLGFEWTQVALALGTTQPEIEQIQLDNPYQTTRQIIVVLIRWRDRQMNRSQEESIRQLVRALEIPERQDLIDDLRKKYNLPVDI